MPIIVEPEYLKDARSMEEALIKSIARSIASDPKNIAAMGAPAASVETVQQQVRKTVEWLADRTSVPVSW